MAASPSEGGEKSRNPLMEQSFALKAQGLPPRGLLLAGTAGVAFLLVLALGLLLDGRAGAFWFGRGAPVFVFPFSIQAPCFWWSPS